MQKLNFLILTLFLLGCSNKNLSQNFIEKKDMFNQFKIYYSDRDNANVSIDSIFYINKNGASQTIHTKSLDIIISKNELSDIISLNSDFNFDGYNDIEIYRPDLSGYNSLSNHFLYRKSEAKFIENKSLDSIYNIVLLQKKKELCSKWRAGQEGYTLIKYLWKNDMLIVTEKNEEGYGADGKIYFSLTKNNKIIINDSILNESIIEKMDCHAVAR